MAVFKVNIEQTFDRTGLIVAIKNFFGISSKEALEKVNSSYLGNFDYEWEVNNLVAAAGHFAKLKIDSKYSQSEIDRAAEQKEFETARIWYLSIPDEDKKMVDILIRNSGPTA